MFGIKRAMGRPIIGVEKGLKSLPCVRWRARYRWSVKHELFTQLSFPCIKNTERAGHGAQRGSLLLGCKPLL